MEAGRRSGGRPRAPARHRRHGRLADHGPRSARVREPGPRRPARSARAGSASVGEAMIAVDKARRCCGPQANDTRRPGRHDDGNHSWPGGAGMGGAVRGPGDPRRKERRCWLVLTPRRDELGVRRAARCGRAVVVSRVLTMLRRSRPAPRPAGEMPRSTHVNHRAERRRGAVELAGTEHLRDVSSEAPRAERDLRPRVATLPSHDLHAASCGRRSDARSLAALRSAWLAAAVPERLLLRARKRAGDARARVC
jgi:hypothetical protein